MNYELAKQLKEAGFHKVCISDECPELRYFPHLEDLIEECGNGFEMLIKYENSCSAGCWGQDGLSDYEPQGKGLTPIEAVANLWLEINKK